MRDTYQSVFAKYPSLTTFGAIVADETSMIARLTKVFAKYKFTVPADARVYAARAVAGTATDISMAHVVAINLEQSSARLMTELLQTTRNTDATVVAALIRTTSLGSHTTAFNAEKATVAAPPSAPTATRPFPAPVTTRTVDVPASIDATGATDVATALKAFILSVPDGSLINFPSTGVYRIDKAIEFRVRHNLILDGNGCTLKYTSVTGTSQSYSFWYNWGRGSDIWIRNFVLIGSSTNPGVHMPGTSPTGGEWQHGVVVASDRFEVSGCTIRAVWGDGFYVTGSPSDVWIHDNHVISAGRQGLSVISGTNVIAEHNAFDKVGYHTFDVEPNKASESSTDIIFRNNTAGTYGKFFFNAVSIPGAAVDGIVVDGNTVTGSSLSTYVDSVGSVRMKRIAFTNNVGRVATRGPVIYFKQVDGMTVTDNIQALTSGVLTKIVGCTGVITS
jgi:hypothetical protein